MNVYELTQNAAYLQQLLEDGDIDEQTYQDSLESMMVDEKVDNVCKVIRNLEAQAAAFKEEEQRLAAKRKVAENGVARLKGSLLELAQAMKDRKAKGTLFTVSVGTSKSVEILAEGMLPKEYLIPQPPKVDKTGIGARLKAGEEIPGALLKESSYVRIK